ncbi:MAG: DUF368 domain-containing protein, partial [Oleiphilaceae bacterium]|nr:DUF368 domain-containing protein [Oleiphilaceae bacterium]
RARAVRAFSARDHTLNRRTALRPEVWLFLKGAMMGAADIVPGVSGGTIAFITGIYERLIAALRGFLPAFIELVKARDWKMFWQQADMTFLMVLLMGIISSVAALAKLISWLLVAYPIPLWSAFFGLIVASVFIVQASIRQRHVVLMLPFLMGAAIAFSLTLLSPVSLSPSLLNAFMSGVLAICAMILPGISGSFILVMLGSYGFILEAITSMNLSVLSIFALGCLVGLLSIAQLLGWAFEHFHDATLAFLTGVMVGALNKVWPWREVLSWRSNQQGDLVPEVERSVGPTYYEQVVGVDAQYGLAILCMVLAFTMVIAAERLARRI